MLGHQGRSKLILARNPPGQFSPEAMAWNMCFSFLQKYPSLGDFQLLLLAYKSPLQQIRNDDFLPTTEASAKLAGTLAFEGDVKKEKKKKTKKGKRRKRKIEKNLKEKGERKKNRRKRKRQKDVA